MIHAPIVAAWRIDNRAMLLECPMAQKKTGNRIAENRKARQVLHHERRRRDRPQGWEKLRAAGCNAGGLYALKEARPSARAHISRRPYRPTSCRTTRSRKLLLHRRQIDA
jgi:tmRNA-binding protein